MKFIETNDYIRKATIIETKNNFIMDGILSGGNLENVNEELAFLAKTMQNKHEYFGCYNFEIYIEVGCIEIGYYKMKYNFDFYNDKITNLKKEIIK